MRCIVCQGDDIQVLAMQEELRVADNIVRVPIRLPVSRVCGEGYYVGGPSVSWKSRDRISRKERQTCERWVRSRCMAESDEEASSV